MFVPSMLTYLLFFSVCEAWILSPRMLPIATGFVGVNGRSASEKNRLRLLCSIILVMYFLMNLAMGYYRIGRADSDANGWYSSNLQNGLIVKQFFSKLAAAEQSLCLARNPTDTMANRAIEAKKGNEDWSFYVLPKCRKT
jgi:hypothetical protein